MLKKFLIIIATVLACASGARAQNRVYIPMSSCWPVPNADIVGQQATRMDNTGTWQEYVSYKFPAGVSSVVGCHFFVPPNTTNYTFQPQFIFRGSTPPDAGQIFLGATTVVNVADDDYDSDAPLIAHDNIVSVTNAPSAFVGATKVATQTQMILSDPGGVTCLTTNPACRDKLATMWVVRLADNNSCQDVRQPWSCCTGLQLGTCVPGVTYGGDVEILGITLPY